MNQIDNFLKNSELSIITKIFSRIFNNLALYHTIYSRLMLKIVFFIAFSVFLYACREDGTSKTSDSQTIREAPSQSVLLKADSTIQLDGLTYSNFEIDTSKVGKDIHGVTLSMDVSVAQNVLEGLPKLGYEGIFFDLECHGNSGNRFACKRVVPGKERVHVNKGFLFAKAGSRRLSFQFPFRNLELVEGEQEIYLTVQALPVKYVGDSAHSEYKKIKKIGSRPISFYRVKCHVKAPSLLRITVCINEFSVDRKKARADKYDFSVGGKGYPDPFWEIVCGDDVVFYSKEVKNSMEYNIKSCSNSFYCSKEDIIRINFLDFDNGPFNTQNDLIESWSTKALNLPTKLQILSFGNISKLVIRAEIENMATITLDKRHKNK